MADDQYPDLTEALKALQSKHDRVVLLRSYLTGTQHDVYDPDRWLDEFGPYVAQPRDNVCETVVKTKTDRLTVGGFTAANGSTTTKKDEEQAAAIWRRSKMSYTSERLHVDAVGLSSSYAMVGLNSRHQAIVSPQDSLSCWIKYDDFETSRALFAAKAWLKGGNVWVQLDYGDRVEEFRSNRDTFRVGGSLPATSASFTLVRTRQSVGSVSMVEYDNGGSDLDNVLSLQDQIHLVAAEILLSAHATGWPVRVVTAATLNGGPATEHPWCLSQ